MKKLLLTSLAIGAISLNASAIEVDADHTAPGGNCTIVGGTAACNILDAEIEDEINSDLPDISIDKYGSGMANSNSFAQKGLGSDYSDKVEFALIKLAIGSAVQGDTDELLDNPGAAEGIGAGAAATFGLNLDILPVEKIGFIDFSKMDLFVSVGAYDADEKNDERASNLEIRSFSVMARYQLVEGVDIIPGYLLEWGGIHLHTGFHRSSTKGSYTQFFEDQSVTSGGVTATIKDTQAKVELDTATTTIPIELSTYLRTIWALTFYGGAGFDFVSGNGDVEITADGVAENSDASYRTIITADDSGSGDADPTNMRAFAGFQVNIPFVRFYTQVNKGLGNDLVGVNAGLKVLW